jgi:hypothetical protein
MKALIHLASDWDRKWDFEKEITSIDELIELSKEHDKGIIIQTLEIEDYQIKDHKNIDMIVTLYNDYIE